MGDAIRDTQESDRMAAAGLERQIERIDELVQRLENADPVARSSAQELVQTLMELHGTALERMLAIARTSGGMAGLPERFAQDDIVRHVLLLYGLHPVDLETRVRSALEKTRPYLRSHGGNVELVEIATDGSVRLRMEGSCHGCPSSAVTLKHAIEEAIYEAAPDVTAIVLDGEAPTPSRAGLVALSYNGRGNSSGADDALSMAAAGPR